MHIWPVPISLHLGDDGLLKVRTTESSKVKSSNQDIGQLLGELSGFPSLHSGYSLSNFTGHLAKLGEYEVPAYRVSHRSTLGFNEQAVNLVEIVVESMLNGVVVRLSDQVMKPIPGFLTLVLIEHQFAFHVFPSSIAYSWP